MSNTFCKHCTVPKHITDLICNFVLVEFVSLEDMLLDDVCNRFTERLKSSFPGLTAAELRIAVLLRFGFSGKQMAAMMGISPTSVTKGKQRLKARVVSALPEGTSIDEFIATF